MEQKNVQVAVLSKQLQQKLGAPPPQAVFAEQAQDMLPAAAPGGGGITRARVATAVSVKRGRPSTDTLFAWNALPNEWIVALGSSAQPQLGGSVSKLFSRGVVRFPSSVQRIEFSTDNISSENQGVMVEGWACWRVSDPKAAVSKLDFSDQDEPMLHASKILAVECAGIMKGLISVKTVHDLLKRREDLIDRLREKLKPTEQRWGIAFDEIGISEVQILSQEVFDNLQRPFRNEAREVASTSDLDTEEKIANKTAAQKERVARLNAENANKLRELEARNETKIREVEIGEEKKRLLGEQEVKGLRIEEEKRVTILQEKAKQDLEEQRTLATQRLEASKKSEEVRLQAQLQTEREKLELERLERAQEIAAAEKALAQAKKLAELELRKVELDAQIEIEKRKIAMDQERELFRLKVQAEERRILGQLSENEIKAKVVDALPKIASSIRIGDIKWYGGSGAQDGPTSILAKAVDQVLDVAESHGIDIRKKNGAHDAPKKG
jgi:hypothetical protein